MLPLGPPDRASLPVQRGVGVRRSPALLAIAARGLASSAGPSVVAVRARIVLDRRLGSATPAAECAAPTRSASTREWIAAARAMRADARCAADRRCADLRRRRERRLQADPQLFLTRGVAAAATGRLQRRTGSSGGARSTTGRACGRAATAGGSSASGGPFELCRSRAASITSAASSPTGRCLGAPTRPVGRWQRGPGRSAVRSGAAPLGYAAADRRGSRRDHRAGPAGSATRLGLPGMVVISQHAFFDAPSARPHRWSTTRRRASPTRDRTTRTRASAGGARSPLSGDARPASIHTSRTGA